MKLRSDMNARTAMVYGGAAFLLVIVGFRSIIATLGDHVGLMTYLSIGAIVLEFGLLLLYAQSIYNLGPEDKPQGGEASSSGGLSSASNKEISELTKAVVKVAVIRQVNAFASARTRELVFCNSVISDINYPF